MTELREKLKTTLTEAIALREVGQITEAINLLEVAIKQFPKEVELLTLMTHCYILNDQIEFAKSHLDKAKKWGAEHALVGWNSARILLKEKNASEALNVAKKTFQRYPNDVEGMYILGACLKENGKITDSVNILDRAIQLKPNYAEALINRGLIKLSQGIKSEALKDLELAHKTKPHIKQIWQLVIGLKLEAQKFSSAVLLLANMIEIDPEDEKNFALLIACNEKTNDNTLAVQSFRRALKVKPDSAPINVNLGVALLQRGDIEVAIDHFKKAIKIKADYAEAYNNLASGLHQKGAFNEAVEAAKKATSINPNYAEAYYNLGTVHKDLGEWEKALEAYEAALAIKPDYIKALNNMANILRDKGFLDKSVLAYKKLVGIKPDHAEAYNNLGTAYGEKGDFSAAVLSYKRAVEIKPDFSEAYSNMGGALRKEGNLEEALKAYENVLALRPADALANHIVASLTGKTTKAAPKEYVMNLFDNYAETFDESLVQELGYFIPKLISQITIAQETRETMGSILDMGCGTGLLGLELKKYCSRIEGIDLSEKMLEKAKLTKVYDRLRKAEILQYLKEEKLEFDYFIATDVFVYIGDLLDIFSAVKTNNGKAGKLVFSTEHTEFGEFSLQESGRYCHSKEYIKKLCAELDFHLTHFSVVDLRKHKGHFLKGGLYILEF